MSEILALLAKQNIQSAYQRSTYSRGLNYFNSGRVEDIEIIERDPQEVQILATVQGTFPYAVSISVKNTTRNFNIIGRCECPMQKECKHVVAALLAAIQEVKSHDISSTLSSPMPSLVSQSTLVQKSPTENMIADPALRSWLQHLEQAMVPHKKPAQTVDTTYGLYYILQPWGQHEIRIELSLVRHLENGGLGAGKAWIATAESSRRYLQPIDKALLAKLTTVNNISAGSGAYIYLWDADGESVLSELFETGRCYWKHVQGQPLSLGEPRPVTLAWEMDDVGGQRIVFNLSSGAMESIFFIENAWYFDRESAQCGRLDLSIPSKLAKILYAAPVIAPEHVSGFSAFLASHTDKLPLAQPKVFQTKQSKKITPIPCLHLQTISVSDENFFRYMRYELSDDPLVVAALSFNYDGTKVAWSDPSRDAKRIEGDTVLVMHRHMPVEKKAVHSLMQHGLIKASEHGIYANSPGCAGHFLFNEHNDIDPLTFSFSIVPELRSEGWQITFDPDYPYQIVEGDQEAWYSSIDEESSGMDWFGFEMGIMLNGEKINLLPILSGVLQQAQKKKDFSLDNSSSILVRLENGKYLPLPTDRLKQIFNVLIELYDTDALGDDDRLRLSKLDVTRLLELEAAMGATQLRWFGGEKLLSIAKKLAAFQGITLVEPPSQFLGQLRPYQQEGLSWLQFLREYELGGVLADDMGLGKTVQALSHLALEKASGRMTTPCLVIAPTSLMFNWQMEAQRFAPDLKVLLLHGTERKNQFEQLADYDLILTTYPLIVRDKTALLAQTFYLLILDEAQFIKNTKSQAAQVAMQLHAKYRLCLTGTPMENHLGELWSLFHFMMPGLLGDQKTFTKVFRTPIEKNANQERRLHLNRRIAPFLLRRTKDKVVQELPAKVEMIRHVALEDKQRDLYETIRITMQEKITQEIAKLGLARSHIIILDALLKLRQVCCDPRLLKIASAKKTASKSAKLELLLDLIPELLQEGRRILVFSQFTEMLALIEAALIKMNIAYVKLTGQTKDRATPIQQFQNKQVPLFLISLKAGGTGLNLTAADTVIHYDPWWNPAVENQATDRAHRIGQEKTVFVYKLVAKGTVEEKILELQEKKSRLMKGLFSEDTTGKLEMTEKDLQGLFEPL